MNTSSQPNDVNNITFIIDDTYQIIKKLGKGATSTVYLAKNLLTNKNYAIKKLRNTKNSSSFLNEIQNLQRLNHKNIVAIVDYKKEGILRASDGKSDTISYIVLEYAENGDLFNYIYHSKVGFGEDKGKKIFFNLINSVSYCHYRGIIHRDLKVENIVLDENWNIKIADFGFSSEICGSQGNGLMQDYLGTIKYAAPEVLRKQPYVGSYADIYSCGIILFVLVTGDFPFQFAHKNDPDYNLLIENEYEIFWERTSKRFDNLSDGFKSIINLMLSYDPCQRPSLSEIKSNTWLTGNNSEEKVLFDEFVKRKNQANKIKVLNMVMNMNNFNKENSNLFKSDKQEIDEDENLKKIPEFFIHKYKNDFKNIKYIPTNNPYVYKFDNAGIEQIMEFFLKLFEDENKYRMKISKKKLKFTLYLLEKPDNDFEENLIIDFLISKLNSQVGIVELIKLSNSDSQFNELLKNIEDFNNYNIEKMKMNE